ncbi:hypothetical protein [Anatilimnocola floriformis]|uniref:hypothetical protein n=1 Tax=Anatilimnocola floriformis TaxID=2948575 RepID=UPI0020C44E0E|nr:hypothetical protein [Anatilimnocola floriformis]
MTSTAIPARLQQMLQSSLQHVGSEQERQELSAVVLAVADAAWRGWIGQRTAEDNRQEHEFVVLDNFLRIAAGEPLTTTDKRAGIAFVFFHDAAFIHRITELEIRAAADEASRVRLLGLKAQQRERHMAEGAANAREVLPTVTSGGQPLLNATEIERCADLIARHDAWKLGQPWPLSDDRLALACVEADALWPLHPLGVLADLERPTETGVPTGDSGDPQQWQRLVANSSVTLREFRTNWDHLPADKCYGETIFRTAVGQEIYRSWAEFWRLG